MGKKNNFIELSDGRRLHKINIGDVLLVHYGDFENQSRLGLFVVLYDNSKEEDKHHLNFLGCKITSGYQDDYSYYVDIPKGMANVEKDSKICTSLIHMMHKKNIVNCIGRLPNEKIIELKNKLDIFMKVIDKQIEDVLK